MSRLFHAAAIAFLTSSVTVLSQAPAPMATPSSGPELLLRVIVVESPEAAARLLARLRAGADFAELARGVSVDPSAVNGGLVGRVAVSNLRPELRDALEGVAEGSLSGIVRVPTGFAVIKVVSPAEGRGPASTASQALLARGSLKYVLNVSGYGEATEALRQFPKPADWYQDPLEICRLRSDSLRTVLTLLEPSAGTVTEAATTPIEQGDAHYLAAALHLYQGRMPQAIGALERALAIARVHLPDAAPQIEQMLGIAHLHKAEMDNGLFHAPGDWCLLLNLHGHPLPAGAADLTKAIDYFLRYLAHHPDDLDVRWLLNLAHMALGTYPDGVPPPHRIPAAAFASAEDVGRFEDVARESGLVSIDLAGGLIVDDFDNDGRLDVVTSSLDSCGPVRLFRRTSEGTFVDDTNAGLAGQLGGLNVVQADYDNDGCLDILVLRGAWEMPQRKSLLRNDCAGRFTDVTVAAGLAVPATRTQAAAWTDINQDGLLDLFVGNENSPAQLFVQKSGGTFEDVGVKAGVARAAFSKGVGAADYDNDGWPDLYVSNLSERNFLYRNNRDGTFTEVGATAGVQGTGQGFATWFFDYDNDGWLDIFATSYITSLEESLRTYLGQANNGDTLRLYRNLGNGRFEDVTRRTGLDKVLMPMGANFGDLDTDGFLDIYLGTGNPSYASLVPSVLLRNRDGASFVDVTQSSGTGELHKGHGVAFADLDGDGDQEIVMEVGGATPGDAHALRLFDNPGHGNDWIEIRLVGRRSNRSAIGARITVTITDEGGRRRSVHRVVGSGGSFGASPLRQHVGLGKGARVVDLEIWWPASGSRQRFADVGRNRSILIEELAETVMPITHTPLPLRRTALR